MGIKSAIVSTPNVREMQKAPVIHKAALCCIFLSSLRGYKRGVLLKNHKENHKCYDLKILELVNEQNLV